MRYVMKQKLFAWGDDFTIKNEANEDVFFVDGKAFSIGDKLSFQDMQHHELVFIRQKLLAWGSNGDNLDDSTTERHTDMLFAQVDGIWKLIIPELSPQFQPK